MCRWGLLQTQDSWDFAAGWCTLEFARLKRTHSLLEFGLSGMPTSHNRQQSLRYIRLCQIIKPRLGVAARNLEAHFAQPVAVFRTVRSACCSCHDINLKGRYRSDLQLPYNAGSADNEAGKGEGDEVEHGAHAHNFFGNIPLIQCTGLRDMPCSTLPACK